MADRHESIKVYFTKNYDKFKFLESNRQEKKPLVKMLIESIGLWNITKYRPMLVVMINGEMWVIDGQHRLIACRKIDEEIAYIIIQEVLTTAQINKMMYLLNLNADKWSPKNFCEHCRDCGMEDYGTLLDFSERHKIKLTTSAALLMDIDIAVGGNGEALRAILGQKFKVRALNKAEDIGKKMKELSGWIPNKVVQSRYFIKALRKFIKDYGNDRYKTLIDRVPTVCKESWKGGDEFPYKVNEREYYELLIDIHDHRTRNDLIRKEKKGA